MLDVYHLLCIQIFLVLWLVATFLGGAILKDGQSNGWVWDHLKTCEDMLGLFGSSWREGFSIESPIYIIHIEVSLRGDVTSVKYLHFELVGTWKPRHIQECKKQMESYITISASMYIYICILYHIYIYLSFLFKKSTHTNQEGWKFPQLCMKNEWYLLFWRVSYRPEAPPTVAIFWQVCHVQRFCSR